MRKEMRNSVMLAIEAGDGFASKMQQRIAIGTVNRAIDALEKLDATRISILAKKSDRYNIINIIPLGDDWSVIETDDDFAKFRTVNMGNLRWEGKCSNSLDEQILITLELKHLGINSQFSEFACNMLKIEIKQ